MRFLALVTLLCVLAAADAFVQQGLRSAGGWARQLQPRMSMVEEQPPQVFIGNMPFTLSEGELKDMVAEKLGGSGFASIKIAKDRATGKSRGFGYVDFVAKEDAEAAVSKLAGLSVDGRELKVDLSVPKEQRAPRTDSSAPRRERAPLAPADQSIFIGNLDFSVTDSEILSMCNDILGEGVVSKVRLAIDRDTGN